MYKTTLLGASERNKRAIELYTDAARGKDPRRVVTEEEDHISATNRAGNKFEGRKINHHEAAGV